MRPCSKKITTAGARPSAASNIVVDRRADIAVLTATITANTAIEPTITDTRETTFNMKSTFLRVSLDDCAGVLADRRPVTDGADYPRSGLRP